jgi:uncharacterized membrane protein (UPF0127 family)
MILLITCAIFVLVVLVLLLSMRQTEPFLSKTRGVFHTQNGLVEVDLEVTETPTEIEHGLMYRTALPPKTGMLFVFQDEAERAFWMRNTLVPLDMIFINSKGYIIHIEHSVPPQNDVLRKSKGSARYVIEVPGGTAQTYNIRIGDRFTRSM